MAEFVAVANVDGVPSATPTVVIVKGIEVALVHVDGSLYAVDNECTQLGGYLARSAPTGSDWAIEDADRPGHPRLEPRR
jgi:nitrite reductase/ring-hydroxylating ferredoxin subunit